MIRDLNTIFSGTFAADGTQTGQPITATAISQNVLDRSGNLALFPTLADEGLSGPEAWLVVQVQTAANGADAAKTLTTTLESALDAGLSSSPVVHLTAPVLTGAQLTIGATILRTQLPSDNYKKFIGMRYTVSAGFTAFNVLAYITPDIQRNVIYPVGFQVL